jgi:hypothetical protein
MTRTISIFLVLVLLSTSINLSIVSHYCGGRLIKTKLITGNGIASCGMNEMTSDCDGRAGGTGLTKEDCCKDDWLQVSIKDSYKNSDFRSELVKVVSAIITAIVQELNPSGYVVKYGIVHYKSPPNIRAVFLPFIQAFLV